MTCNPSCKRCGVLFVLSALLCCVSAAGSAQFGSSNPTRGFRPPPEVGPRGSYDFDTRAWGVGAQFRYALAPVADVAFTADFFVGDESAVQVNLDLTSGAMVPGVYLGGGLAVGYRSFLLADIPTQPKRAKLGFTFLLGGTVPPSVQLPVRPRVELRWTFVNDFDTQAALAFGTNVPLGSPPTPARGRPR